MIGRTVGHYRITSKLGEGGMGEVFLAEDTRLERKAAIKFLPADMAADPDRRRRFLAEARAASALNHPHVCVVYDVGEVARSVVESGVVDAPVTAERSTAESTGEATVVKAQSPDAGLLYIAMEFVEGQPLNVLVAQGSIEIARVVEILAQVADALDAAHSAGIVHRDIKPGNISLDKRGQVKVLDFGLAKRMPSRARGEDLTQSLQATQQGQVLGTPSYMSPEQALGKEVDHRSDLFSVGVVLYNLLTGQLPFTGATFTGIVNNIVHGQPPAIARFNYDVPPELERITLKCLQKSPDRRYQSARELLIDLRNLARELEHGPATAAAMGGGEGAAVPAGSPRPRTTAEPFSLEKLRTCDVLLNYAAIDDYALQEDKPGWVSQLHRNLEVRMEQLSGEKVQIARLPEEVVAPAIEAEILQQVPKAKAMISVVSPPFLKSPLCRREVEQFWRGAGETGGPYIKDKSRLLKVVKTAVSEQMPQPLSEIFSPLVGFEFFELDADTGRVREFDETFGPVLKQRFFERVYDLAYDGCQVLSLLKEAGGRDRPGAAAAPHQRWVYLATTTSDVADERDRIRRELLERGHEVLPDAPLPMTSRDAEAMVRGSLARCTIAIHLLGHRYGVTPEDSQESLQALQVRLTAEQASRPDFQRLIWMPGGEPADERQRAFVRRVQEDPQLHRRAEVIEGNLSVLKHDLIRRLAPPEDTSHAATPARTPGDTPKLYLICDRNDEGAVEALHDYLFAQGLEVMLPAFDGNDADAAALHQDSLLTCDAVLVYYGAAPRAWVDIKLRELLKAAGYGREAPIAVQAVYVAPPDDHRKERFQSHQAAVIRQSQTFQPSAALDGFVSQVRGLPA